MTYSLVQAEATRLHHEEKMQVAIIDGEMVCWKCLGRKVLDGWLRTYNEDPIEHMNSLPRLTPAQLTGKDKCTVCGKCQKLALAR